MLLSDELSFERSVCDAESDVGALIGVNDMIVTANVRPCCG